MAESEYGRECMRAKERGGRVARRVDMRRAPRADLCIEWLAVAGRTRGED